MFLPNTRGSALLREASENTAALERRFTPDITLGQREMIAVRLRELAHDIIQAGEPDELVDRYKAMQARLAALDEAEFAPLRAQLQAAALTPDGLRAALQAMPQYDWDAWTRRVFDLHVVPNSTVEMTPEMVGYVTTHIVQVFEVASELGPSDVLYDLGSGLGFVPIVASWLTGARAVGIEIEPAYVARARERAAALGLSERVTFRQQDLREAELGDATAVFMFYPCRDAMLDAVLLRLEPVARARPIKIYSLGLSGPPLIARPWVKVRGQSPSGLLALESVPGAPTAAEAAAARAETEARAAEEARAAASKTSGKAASKKSGKKSAASKDR